MNSLPSISTDVFERLKEDPEFRRSFFASEASSQIARQLIALRERRGFSQGELAKKIGTQQPAISRVESADYRSWSFNTLRRIAETLDARLRISIEPTEDILAEYREDESPTIQPSALLKAETQMLHSAQRAPTASLNVAGGVWSSFELYQPSSLFVLNQRNPHGTEINRIGQDNIPHKRNQTDGPTLLATGCGFHGEPLQLSKVSRAG